MLDFVVCDRHLAPHIGLFLTYYGFKPHIVCVRLVINLAFEPDVGKIMVCPTERVRTLGPRLPHDDWSSHWLSAQAIEPELQVPWDDTASIEATRLYARFGYAVESYMLATDPYATPANFGRASCIAFKEQEVSFAGGTYLCLPYLLLLGTAWFASQTPQRASSQ